MTRNEPIEVHTRNPATGAVLAAYPVDDAGAVEAAVARTHEAFLGWRATPMAERSALLAKLGAALEAEGEHAGGGHLARLMTTEMGKTLREARAEVAKCARLAAWYAEHGPAMLADERVDVGGEEAYVSFLPIGTVLAIMPWNFPLWQVLRAAVPIILGGNAFLLKHAPNVLGSGYAVRDLFERIGAPPGLLGALNIGNEAVASLLHDPRIAAVTLTGSVGAGSAVASIAGKVVKKSLLELGGSDPFIVLADADVEAAVAMGITARFQNAGQVCLAAKRFILEAPIAEEFSRRFAEAARTAVVMGDPMNDETTIGPIARADLRDGLDRQVRATLAEGAELMLGGHPRPGPGFFYEPTVFGRVRRGMTAFGEETFGPVAAMVVASDAEEAIALANDSEFGLGGNLWTRNIDRARAIARRLETGAVFVNGYTITDPRVPVGGVKKSGYGRELSHFGAREFVNAQTVWIKR